VPATLTHEGHNVYRLDLSGSLTKEELDRSQDALLSAIGPSSTRAKVRLLVVLQGFLGWDRDSGWGDLTFYAKHGDRIEKIAIVGERRWQDHARMFAAADLRRAPVEYFLPTSMEEARIWLTR
jgi:hypothetical protein